MTPLPPRLPAQVAQQVVESAKATPQQVRKKLSWRATVSTGSLLLDLAISGLKTRYGGLPGGIIVEISGPPGSAKTTILGEIAGAVQRHGGMARIKDSEARLDATYCKQMGVKLPMVPLLAEGPRGEPILDPSGKLVPDPEIYSVPKTVTDIIEAIIGPMESKQAGNTTKLKRNWDLAWRPNPSFVNFEGEDSLAALSTRFEMEQGDKMGQRRAKEFSEGFRQICAHIKDYNILMVCSNQLRENTDGGLYGPKTVTPGGMAKDFYYSVRIQLRVVGKIKKDDIVIGKDIEAFISKSSLDIEYRSAPLRIVFGYGIDDLGANLQWLKKHGQLSELNGSKYAGYVIGDKMFPVNTPGGALGLAIKYVEDNDLEQDIRELVVDTWNKLEQEARPQRKEKVR